MNMIDNCVVLNSICGLGCIGFNCAFGFGWVSCVWNGFFFVPHGGPAGTADFDYETGTALLMRDGELLKSINFKPETANCPKSRVFVEFSGPLGNSHDPIVLRITPSDMLHSVPMVSKQLVCNLMRSRISA